ncbi:MAG: phage holin family protein [Nitrospiraceae bacterium]|nr:phage holin family protein [Nitrospiraceae bacterium]MDA8326397.1 phage holin family protein [Nitrospiraceae bacterium]
MGGFVLRIVINAVSLAAAVDLVGGLKFEGKWWMMLLIAVIFGFVNSFIKPLMKLLMLPFLILTLGFFTLVINAFMLELTAWLSRGFNMGFYVEGFCAAFKGALVISIVNMLLQWATAGMYRER